MSAFAAAILVFLLLLTIAVVLQVLAARERKREKPGVEEALNSVAVIAQKRYVQKHGREDTELHRLMKDKHAKRA